MLERTLRKRYLVTGGAGFIGSGLVKGLLAAGAKVRVLDDLSRGHPRRLREVAGDIELISGDVRDEGSVVAAAKGCESILHLAYVNGTEFFYTKPELVLDVGVRGMLNVLTACRATNIGELVLASSSEVYQTPPVVPTDENVALSVPDPLNPRYSYGGGKIISELMAINYGRTGFERVVIFRPHNVYGPDMGWEHVVPQFATRMHGLVTATGGRAPVEFPIQGTGEETRSYIHIDDFTAGMMTLLARAEHLGIYNIGTEEEVSVRGLAEAVAAHFGVIATIKPGALLKGGTARRCPAIGKMRALGFEPKISLRAGLAGTIPWYVKHPTAAAAA